MEHSWKIMKPYYIISLIIIILPVLFSCNPDNKESRKAVTDSLQSESKNTGDILIPKFEIRLQLSGEAEAKLKAVHESVFVDAYISGEPKDGVNDSLVNEVGLVDLCRKDIELTDTRIAVFENLHLSKSDYDLLRDKDYEVLINVWTGRRSSEYNLLDCEFLQLPVSKVANKTFVLKGKLIGE